MMSWKNCEADTCSWLRFLRIYLLSIGVGNLVWETAHLPLYTIWKTGAPREQAFAVLHCTAGDLLIALSSLVMALMLAGNEKWPRSRFIGVASLVVVFGVAYTVFSEWLNVVIREAWAYSEYMPLVSLGSFPLGISPVLQWIIVPAGALAIARRFTVTSRPC